MSGRITVLTGGVGGAKLVLGLTQVASPDSITAIVNTGDDFRHLGLAISPDIDTLLYTLAGKANVVQGWGREGETWSFMESLRSLGGEGWFLLGDGDLALHVERSHLLANGASLSAVTDRFARAWGVGVAMLPMSDGAIGTHLDTDEGDLPFQRYFVERRCEPAVRAIRFEGAETARPTPGVLDAITGADVVLVAPSNPYLSVDPILAMPGIREALAATRAPVVAVSPLVDGKAVKGPTAKLMGELGLEVTTATIAAHYAPWLDAMLIDERDRTTDLPIPSASADTLMNTLEDKARVARAALALARSL